METKILIVDDEGATRDSLVDMLCLEGYSLTTTQDGKSALKLLQQEQFDVAILNLDIGNMNGIDVLCTTNCDKKTRFIILTGFGTIETAIQAIQHRVHDYILKPASPNTILASVKKAIAGDGGLLETEVKGVRKFREPKAAFENINTLNDGTVIDISKRTVLRADIKLTLTISENRLIQTFLEQRNIVISHRDLVHRALGYDIKDWEAPEILRPLISRLRQKLSALAGMAERIINIRGAGYFFEDE